MKFTLPFTGIPWDHSKLVEEVNYVITQFQQVENQRVWNITNSLGVDPSEWTIYNSGPLPEHFLPGGTTLVDKASYYQEGYKWFPIWARTAQGHWDHELIHWNPLMPTPEIQQLTENLRLSLGVPALRCRLSQIQGPSRLGSHMDPHTPWRVHLNIDQGPETRWLFGVDNLPWQQPQNSLWLMRTGNCTHDVEVEERASRVQLFWHIWEPKLPVIEQINPKFFTHIGLDPVGVPKEDL